MRTDAGSGRALVAAASPEGAGVGAGWRRARALAAAAGLLAAGVCRAQSAWAAYADGNGVYLLRSGVVQLWFDTPLWGPNWAWTGYRAEPEPGSAGFRLTGTIQASGTEVTLRVAVRQTGPAQATVSYAFAAARETPLTLAAVTLAPRGALRAGGRASVRRQDGDTTERPVPFGRQPLGDAVACVEFLGEHGEHVSVTLSPPAEVQADGDARVVLARGQARAGAARELTLTVDVPGELRLVSGPDTAATDTAGEDWFPWAPAAQLPEASVIGMEDWLDAPAGRQGRVSAEGDRLLCGGKPIRLWGLNLCYGACAPPRDLADRRARFYARYGINAVRLHKYADGPGWAGIQAADSFAAFEPEALDRMDYQVARLKEKGIYVTLSPTFGVVTLGPGDREAVPFLEEFGALGPGASRVNTGHGSLYLSSELQDLQIRQMVALLKHRNPYTALTYAEDPAVAAIEMVNEHSALFYSVLHSLQKYPSLRQRAAARFSAWLRQRYRDDAGLREAWGEAALNSFAGEGFRDESLAAESVVPAGNPWYYDPDQLSGSQQFRRRRLLDTMRFLYELQNEFYARYARAVREAGYGGLLVASNWQAGRACSHYLNLHSDALIGIVDRHNYVGGMEERWIDDATLLAAPGSGLLSSGLQQVADRPFMLSEWIHCFPSEWGVEGPALVGAYGMGLQGWDASFLFQNRDTGAFSDRLGRETWDVTAPQILGVFPAVARQVHRGDVRQAEEPALRYVHVPSLFEGRLGFEESVRQDADVKAFGGVQVPAETLAVTRTAVAFTDAFRETPAFDLSRFLSGEGALRSATGELNWRPGRSRHDGRVTVDTPGTQAVIGFAQGERCELRDVAITPRSPFAAVYVTAIDKEGTIASSRRLLVTALARARNTGAKIVLGRFLAARGEAPVRMEPVAAEIRFRRPGPMRVTVLDHDGCRTTTEVPAAEGAFAVDGARYRTIYYEVAFE